MLGWKAILNTIRNLQWRSYFRKNLLLCFAFLFVLFSLIALAMGRNYMSGIENEQYKFQSEIYDNVSYQIKNMLDRKSDAYNTLITDLAGDFDIFRYSKEIDFSRNSDSIVNIKKSMEYFCGKEIESIYIFSPVNRYVISTNIEFSSDFQNIFRDFGWSERWKETQQDIMHRQAIKRGYIRNYLTFIQTVPIKNEEEILIAYNINIDSFRQTINETVNEVWLLDEQGKVIFTYEENSVSKNIEELEEKGACLERIVESSKKSMIEGNVAYMSGKIDGKYNLIVGMDNSRMTIEKEKFIFLFALIIFISAILSFVQSFLLVMKLYSNLLDLVLTVGGNHTEESQYRSLDEVAFIKREMLTVLDKNTRIEDELSEKIDVINKTKIAALQSQINPHYIYNTLNLISLINIRENKQDTETSEALTAFADTMRYAMDQSDYSVPFCKEIEYVKKYLFIQSLKYKDRLEVSFDVAPNTLDKMILKLTLQPIVENAISHGLRPKSGDWKIKICSEIHDGMLQIKVIDNGIGFKSEIQDALKEEGSLEKFDKTHAHGLLNLNQRCKLFYGETFGCEILSENHLTAVVIKYPVLTGNMEETEE